MSKPSMLLYLHGFNSSPMSHKAGVMREYCQQQRPDIKIEIPQLPSFPKQTAEFLGDFVHRHQNDYNIGLVGSSLGGYLSTWLHNQYGFRAVLINPAVKPFELLQDFFRSSNESLHFAKLLSRRRAHSRVTIIRR